MKFRRKGKTTISDRPKIAPLIFISEYTHKLIEKNAGKSVGQQFVDDARVLKIKLESSS